MQASNFSDRWNDNIPFILRESEPLISGNLLIIISALSVLTLVWLISRHPYFYCRRKIRQLIKTSRHNKDTRTIAHALYHILLKRHRCLNLSSIKMPNKNDEWLQYLEQLRQAQYQEDFAKRGEIITLLYEARNWLQRGTA